MIYAKVDNSNTIVKYPYIHRTLREDNPNVSFPLSALTNPETRSTYNVVEVDEVERPVKLGWNVVEETPTLDGSQWRQSWSSSPKLDSQIQHHEYTKIPEPVKEGYFHEEGLPVLEGDEWKQVWNEVKLSWLENRKGAYGTPESQIEFITENGLEAWQARVAEIKAKYPKE